MADFFGKGKVRYYIGETIKTFFPCKGDKKRYALFKVIYSLFLVACIVFTCFAVWYFHAFDKQTEDYSKLRNIFYQDGASYQERFKKLKEINYDIEYWLHSNFGADAPVAISDDDYYKNHGIDGNKSRFGMLYADKNAKGGKNLVIYGNNSADGTLFGNLAELRTVSGFKRSSLIELVSATESKPYMVFSVMLLASDKKDDNGESFDYAKDTFKDFAEFSEWEKEAEERSIINAKIKLHYEQNILCLVTDAPDFKGAKLVVMACEVDKDTNVERTNEAVANAQVRYPKIWYDKNGYDYPEYY